MSRCIIEVLAGGSLGDHPKAAIARLFRNFDEVCMRFRRLIGKWRQSSGQHHAKAQQVEADATVHGPFDELEPVYLSFHWSIAPGLLQSGQQRGLILAKAFCKIGE
jgi:hypothetical protein